MAKRGTRKAEPKDATRAVNVGERKKAITNGIKELYAISRKVARIRENEIAPLNEDMKAIRQRLRDDFQVPGNVINIRLAAYKLEREGDDDTAYALGEVFEALPLGTQLDIFKQPKAAAETTTNGNGRAQAAA